MIHSTDLLTVAIFLTFSYVENTSTLSIITAAVAQTVRRLCYGLDDRGSIPGRGWGFSLLQGVKTDPGVIEPPIQWKLESDNSPPSTAEVRNAWSYTSTSLVCLHGVVLN
jgi:hypothetical protein